MRYKILLPILILLYASSFAQNVGIGTTNPNSSAILEVASNNKGILLPRVTDTAVIAAPAEGLLMYNQASKAPNYFDGTKWNNVADARNNFVPLHGNITYTITGTTTVSGLAVDNAALAAIDYSNASILPVSSGGGGGGVGIPRGMDSIVIYKEFDGNSIVFKRAHLAGINIQTIEIQHFLPAAGTPFYSVKLSNVRVGEQAYFISEKTGKLTERYSLMPITIGYKDWLTNKSFSYNVSARTFGSY